jgi:hypothetical protein
MSRRPKSATALPSRDGANSFWVRHFCDHQRLNSVMAKLHEVLNRVRVAGVGVIGENLDVPAPLAPRIQNPFGALNIRLLLRQVLSSGRFGRSAKEIQRCSGDFIIGTKFADTTGRFFGRYFSREIFSQDAPDLGNTANIRLRFRNSLRSCLSRRSRASQSRVTNSASELTSPRVGVPGGWNLPARRSMRSSESLLRAFLPFIINCRARQFSPGGRILVRPGTHGTLAQSLKPNKSTIKNCGDRIEDCRLIGW